MTFSCFVLPGTELQRGCPITSPLVSPLCFLVEEVGLGCLWWQGTGAQNLYYETALILG